MVKIRSAGENFFSFIKHTNDYSISILQGPRSSFQMFVERIEMYPVVVEVCLMKRNSKG